VSEQINNGSNLEDIQAEYDLLNSFFELEEACQDIQSLAEITKVEFDGLVDPPSKQLSSQLTDFFLATFETSDILKMSGQVVQKKGHGELVEINLQNEHQKVTLLSNNQKQQLVLNDKTAYQLKWSDYLSILAGLKGAKRADTFSALLESASFESIADFYPTLGQNSSTAYTIFADLGDEVSIEEMNNSCQTLITTGMAEYLVTDNNQSRTETLKITRHHQFPRQDKPTLNTVYSGSFIKCYDPSCSGQVSFIDAHKFSPNEFCISSYSGFEAPFLTNKLALPPINDYNELLKRTLEETIKRTKIAIQ
jgi:predicted regulator of Ras-like GTPase activity (Roadblock/LC7/MglB family)